MYFLSIAVVMLYLPFCILLPHYYSVINEVCASGGGIVKGKLFMHFADEKEKANVELSSLPSNSSGHHLTSCLPTNKEVGELREYDSHFGEVGRYRRSQRISKSPERYGESNKLKIPNLDKNSAVTLKHDSLGTTGSADYVEAKASDGGQSGNVNNWAVQERLDNKQSCDSDGKKKQNGPARHGTQKECLCIDLTAENPSAYSERESKSFDCAPLTEIWVKGSRDSKALLNESMQACRSLLGRHLVWDEGYYSDTEDNLLLHCDRDKEDSGSIDTCKTRGMWTTQMYQAKESAEAACTGKYSNSNRSSLNGANYNNSVSASNGAENEAMNCKANLSSASQKQVQTRRSTIRTNESSRISEAIGHLATGNLNPHTLVECQAYQFGPELRFSEALFKSGCPFGDFAENENVKSNKVGDNCAKKPSSPPFGKGLRDISGLTYQAQLSDDRDILSSIKSVLRSELHQTQNLTTDAIRDIVQPFSVRVSPDAALLIDLHTHLAMCEVIGFLGGRWVNEERCLYIQVNSCLNQHLMR